MLISVLMPARNASATVEDALRGIRSQRDAPPYEVVCVDDASTDATPQLLARAGVTVVKGHGVGLVAALNLGLAHCKGDLVARMDADDLVHPDRLRLQAALLESDRSLGAAGSLVECDARAPGMKRLERWLNETVTKEQCRNARFIEAPLVHPSTTFRRDALVGGWQDNGWAEDWDLLLRLVEAGWELAKVPEKLLTWRDFPDRLTRTHEAYGEERMFRLRAHYLARGPLKAPSSTSGAPARPASASPASWRRTAGARARSSTSPPRSGRRADARSSARSSFRRPAPQSCSAPSARPARARRSAPCWNRAATGRDGTSSSPRDAGHESPRVVC